MEEEEEVEVVKERRKRSKLGEEKEGIEQKEEKRM